MLLTDAVMVLRAIEKPRAVLGLQPRICDILICADDIPCTERAPDPDIVVRKGSVSNDNKGDK